VEGGAAKRPGHWTGAYKVLRVLLIPPPNAKWYLSRDTADGRHGLDGEAASDRHCARGHRHRHRHEGQGHERGARAKGGTKNKNKNKTDGAPRAYFAASAIYDLRPATCDLPTYAPRPAASCY
jgi:hypothetical protein